jgi:hypothetical protein
VQAVCEAAEGVVGAVTDTWLVHRDLLKNALEDLHAARKGGV